MLRRTTTKLAITVAPAKPVGVSVKKLSGATLTAVAAGSQGEKLGLKAGMTVLTVGHLKWAGVDAVALGVLVAWGRSLVKSPQVELLDLRFIHRKYS